MLDDPGNDFVVRRGGVDDQGVGRFVCDDPDVAAGWRGGRWLAGGRGGAGGGHDLVQRLTQGLGQRLGIGVLQVVDIDVGALLRRFLVESVDERADAGDVVAGGQDHQNVGGGVGDDATAVAGGLGGPSSGPGRGCRPLGQNLVGDFGDLLGHGMAQGNHFDLVKGTGPVEFADDPGQAFDIGGAVGDQQGVGRSEGGNVAGLGEERRQHRRCHQGRVGVTQGNHAGHVLFPPAPATDRQGVLLGVPDRYDLMDLAGGDDGEALHPENGEEEIVGFVAAQLQGGGDGDAPLDSFVVDEIAAGHFADDLDQGR